MEIVNARTLFLHGRYFSHINDKLQIVIKADFTTITKLTNHKIDIFATLYSAVNSIRARINQHGKDSVFQCPQLQYVFKSLNTIISKLHRIKVRMNDQTLNNSINSVGEYIMQLLIDLKI